MRRASEGTARRACVAAAFAAASALAGCRGAPDPAFTELLEARRVAAELHVQFIKAAGASDRAVLADTDEASAAFAREAESAAQSVQAGLGDLGALLRRLHYEQETKILDELAGRFADYRKVDEDVLALAVENTNLKAQRLSFGPVREAADAFRDALGLIVKAAPPKDLLRMQAAEARAVLAVRDVQVLQAPHIAEADDPAMSRLEKEMAAREAAAREELKVLAAHAPKPALDAATAALDRFEKLSAELVALSRRNTNVKSLALSLKRKPALTAACDASFVELEAALARRGFAGTR